MTRATLVTVLLAFSGCSSVEMVVRAYADPSAGSVRTFGFVPSDQTTGGELAERELRASVRTLLVAKGLSEASGGQAPDVSIQVSGQVQSQEQYIPPSTHYKPKTVTTTTTTTSDPPDPQKMGKPELGMGDPKPTTTTTTTEHTEMVPVTKPGHTETTYYRHIAIQMFRTTPGQDPVWSGDVESRGTEPDLMVVAPTLLKELLSEFPRRTGKPAERSAALSRDLHP